MAYIYVTDQNTPLQDAVNELKRRTDRFHSVEKDGWIYVDSKRSLKPLRFRPQGGYQDPYGQSWTISGDFSLLDIKTDGASIMYGDYPDALARLYSAMHSHRGRFVIADAKPGFQFAGEKSPSILAEAAMAHFIKRIAWLR